MLIWHPRVIRQSRIFLFFYWHMNKLTDFSTILIEIINILGKFYSNFFIYFRLQKKLKLKYHHPNYFEMKLINTHNSMKM